MWPLDSVNSIWSFPQEWTDEVLQWDPEDYGGHNVLVLPAEEIWVPDLYIFNK